MSDRIELASSPCGASEAALGFSPAPSAGQAIAVLVLAGGEGRRMGGDKPARLLAGRPLLSHAWEKALCYTAVAALGVREASQVGAALDAEYVTDAHGIEGPLAGLAAGLSWAARRDRPWLLTLPCDAPFLPRDLAERLLSAAVRAGAAVAIAKAAGRLHPACSLWSTRLRKALSTYAASGRSSLIGFAEASGFAVAEWTSAAGDPFFNVNTPADLAAAERLIAQPHLE